MPIFATKDFQKGIAQILIILFLVIGLLVGLYVVRQTQVLNSRANSTAPEDAKSNLLQNASAPYDEFNNQIVLDEKDKDFSYQVEYQPEFDQFILVIYKTPIEKVREDAEQALLAKSGDLDSLCALQFTVLAPHFVASGENYTDDTLDLCKKRMLQLEGSDFSPHTFQFETLSPQKDPPGQFLSDLQIVTSEQFPMFVYIKLCRNNGQPVEGVWHTRKDPLIGEFLYNQRIERCNNPTPNYLVFTEPVPEGTLVALCESKTLPWRESVWKVNSTGYTADYVTTHDDCTLPPSPDTTETSANQVCSTGRGFCSTNFLVKYFPNDPPTLIQASQICNKESLGTSSVVAPDGGVGLFQISLPSHGQTVKYWQNITNNVTKAVQLSNMGSDWHQWSAAYDYVCWDNKPIKACGFIKGKPSWQKECVF